VWIALAGSEITLDFVVDRGLGFCHLGWDRHSG